MYILLTYRVNMFAYLNIILPKSGMTMTYWLATQEPYIVEYVQIRMTAHAIFFCMCTRYVICISRQRFPMILKKYKQYFSVLSPLHCITLSTILLFLGSTYYYRYIQMSYSLTSAKSVRYFWLVTTNIKTRFTTSCCRIPGASNRMDCVYFVSKQMEENTKQKNIHFSTKLIIVW